MIIWIVTTVIILGVFILGTIYFFQEKLIFPPEKLPLNYQYEFGGNWKERIIEINNVKINAVHFKTKNPEGIVIYFHGNADSLSSWGYVGLDFTKLNLDVLIYDYRGYGKSEGKIGSEKQLLSDAQFIYDTIKKEYDETKIYLYGRSIGTGIAANIAANNAPKALLLETPYTSLNKLGGEIYPPFITVLMKYKLPTYKYVEKINCPIYLFHGTADELINYNHSIELVAIKKSITLFTFKGATHNNIPEFPEYHIALAEIFSN